MLVKMLSHNNSLVFISSKCTNTTNCILAFKCFYLSSKKLIMDEKGYKLCYPKFIRHTDVFVMIFTGNNNYEFELIFRHVHACYRSIEEMKN